MHPQLLRQMDEAILEAVDRRDDDASEGRFPLKPAVCERWAVSSQQLQRDADLEALLSRSSNDSLADWLETTLDSEKHLGVVVDLKEIGSEYRWAVIVDARAHASDVPEATGWHELAHVIAAETLERGPLESRQEDSDSRALVSRSEPTTPAERLVAREAARLQCWRSPDDDRMGRHLHPYGGLTFELIDNIESALERPVSFYATAIRCVRRFHRPCMLVRIDRNRKRANKGIDANRELFETPELQLGEPPLRMVETITPRSTRLDNPMEIGRNMRLPESSVLRDMYESEAVSTRSEYTDQSNWETSSRGYFPELPLYVEARQVGPNTLGLIQPDWNRLDPKSGRAQNIWHE